MCIDRKERIERCKAFRRQADKPVIQYYRPQRQDASQAFNRPLTIEELQEYVNSAPSYVNGQPFYPETCMTKKQTFWGKLGKLFRGAVI